ncbi:MAG: hypothetical protein FK733_17590 [Asgard group archaeon]|nr:hypothetical protein [Asgard group archaeon]
MSEVLSRFAKSILDSDVHSLGESITEDNIAFVPIIKTSIPREKRDYLTVDEALEEKVLEIIDKGTEIEHLVAKNLGNIPILIEEGEILAGDGTQDRIVLGSIILQAEVTIEIPVKCVHAPHPLSTGSGFAAFSKPSRAMLGKMRSMKSKAAEKKVPTSDIDQSEMWETVQQENVNYNVDDKSQYRSTIGVDMNSAKKRKIEFPKGTIGVIAISDEGKIVGVEIHRVPRAFSRRKIFLMTSMERQFKKKKKPIASEQAKKKSKKFLEQLTKIDDKEVKKQLEVDGVLFKLDDGTHGEYVSNRFYSDICPNCGKKKQKVAVCKKCKHEEEAEEELMYASMY